MKRPCLFFRLPVFLGTCSILLASSSDQRALVRQPPPVDFQPGAAHSATERRYQGIPTLERAGNGRLWASWYAGPVHEDRYNYVVVATSGDDGRTWSELKLTIDPDGDGPVRASDPCLWLDPGGKLWLFWFQNYENDITDSAIFAITTENPGEENPIWSSPRFIFDGIMLNKPVVLANGDWLLPAALWWRPKSCRVIASSDQGASWSLRGTATVPEPEDRHCDEPMIVERQDGSLWMLVRTRYGIGESTSRDAGRTWTNVAPTELAHSPARFYLRRLASGRLMLVKHGPLSGKPVGRKQLTAFLSDNDGTSWKGGLVLDERAVSYPDGTQAPDGTIYIIYDHERFDAKHILMAAFSETDVLQGTSTADAGPITPVVEHEGIQNLEGVAAASDRVSAEVRRSAKPAAVIRAPSSGAAFATQARLRVLVNQATGVNTKPWLRDGRFLKPQTNRAEAALLAGPGATLEIPASLGQPVQLEPSSRFLIPPEGTYGGLHVLEAARPAFRESALSINVIPEAFAGKRYLPASFQPTTVKCLTDGVVYVATPTAERNPKGAAAELTHQGFSRVAVPEFVLCLTKDGRAVVENLCSVFQKRLKAGEEIQLKGWGLVVY